MTCHKQQLTGELAFGCFGCPCFVDFLDRLSYSPLRDKGFVVVAERGLWAVMKVLLADLVYVWGGDVLGIDLLVLDVLMEECFMAFVPLFCTLGLWRHANNSLGVML
jgi:hypothetical protein